MLYIDRRLGIASPPCHLLPRGWCAVLYSHPVANTHPVSQSTSHVPAISSPLTWTYQQCFFIAPHLPPVPALTGRIRVLVDGLMWWCWLLLLLLPGYPSTTVHAYTLAIMDLLPLLARLADVPRKANLRSISGRRDLCDFLIKLQIDFYRPLAPGTKWRLRSDSYINRHTARDVPARADDLYICCCVLPDPYPEDDYVCCGCHWACLGCVTAHSQRAEHEMTTTIATYIRVLFCGVDGGWVSEWQ